MSTFSNTSKKTHKFYYDTTSSDNIGFLEEWQNDNLIDGWNIKDYKDIFHIINDGDMPHDVIIIPALKPIIPPVEKSTKKMASKELDKTDKYSNTHYFPMVIMNTDTTDLRFVEGAKNLPKNEDFSIVATGVSKEQFDTIREVSEQVTDARTIINNSPR